MMRARLTPDMIAAVETINRRMFETLEDQFPGKGMQLFTVACADTLCVLLNMPALAPEFAPMVEQRLRGTPYALVERRAN